MRIVKRLFTGSLALGLSALFAGAAGAVDISFDGTSRKISVNDYLRDAVSDQPRFTAVPVAAAGAHVYDFKTLYAGLGYPSPNYFGSPAAAVQDLETYTSKDDTFYGEINGYLRYYPGQYDWYGTGPADAKVIVAHIDRIFEKVPAIPEDLILFRGLGLGYRAGKPFTIGEEFTDKGYVSTSLTYSVARHFAVEMDRDEAKPSRRAIFAIYLTRPGEKGILVDQGEDEIILKHGRKFRVMSQKAGVTKYDLYLVQACSDTCDTTLRGDVREFWDNFTVQD